MNQSPPHPPLKPINLFQQFSLGVLSGSAPVCPRIQSACQPLEGSTPLSSRGPLSCRHMGEGCPEHLPLRVPALPRGPWETLSHTRGHQNSILVFNHGPFEAVPRKIPRRRMVLRTWSFQVRSFCETRTAGNISGVVYSIYFTFLLIGICLLGELRASRIGPGTQSQGTIKQRDFPCLHTRPADGSLQTDSESVPKMHQGRVGDFVVF